MQTLRHEDERAARSGLHPQFPGEATVGEMIRQFWRYATGRRSAIGLQIALSLAGFALKIGRAHV